MGLAEHALAIAGDWSIALSGHHRDFTISDVVPVFRASDGDESGTSAANHAQYVGMAESGTGGAVCGAAVVDDSGGSEQPGQDLSVVDAGISGGGFHNGRVARCGAVSGSEVKRGFFSYLTDFRRMKFGWADFCRQFGAEGAAEFSRIPTCLRALRGWRRRSWLDRRGLRSDRHDGSHRR